MNAGPLCMEFTSEQVAALNAKLDPLHVAERTQAGRKLSYIEGWWAIAEANRIFGFDGWHRETVDLQETHRALTTVPGYGGKPDYEQWRVSFIARVRVTVGGIVREGTGYGSGMAKPEALGDAIESAVKEAETDAMKRAFMTFGNPFGLALYDKTQANVGVNTMKQEFDHQPTASEPPRKDNGLPEKGWREDGTRTSYALKKEQPELWTEFQRELAECQTLVMLEKFKTEWREKVTKERWNPTYKATAKDCIEQRESEIIDEMERLALASPDELAELPVKTALEHSLNEGQRI